MTSKLMRSVEEEARDTAALFMPPDHLLWQAALHCIATALREREQAVWREGWEAGREAAALIAEHHEAPYYREHPGEKVLADLQGAILQAALNFDRTDDSQPERACAEAVFAYLQNEPTALDRLFGRSCVSSAIRATPPPRAGREGEVVT